MLRTSRGDPAAAGTGPGSLRRALVALCVTEIVSYGVIYYAFPVLAGQITAQAGWSRTAITAAYSAGSLAGAVAGIPAGRLLQHRGPRAVMTAGSVLGAAAVAGIAAAPSYWWFVVAWLAAGAASAGLFYAPAFAPLTSALAAHVSWRAVYLILAAVLAAVTIPAHALALRTPWPPRLAQRAEPGPALAVVRSSSHTLRRTVRCWPAAWALGLGGAGQVAGRLCYRALDARTGVRARATAIIAAGAVITLLLGLLPGPAALLVVASVIAGAVRGVFTAVMPARNPPGARGARRGG